MSFQFRSKANFQNFVKAIKSTNLQTHEPVNFKKTTKIEPNENKVFHSIDFHQTCLHTSIKHRKET